MSPQEKATALSLLEGGRAELAVPQGATVSSGALMRQTLADASELAQEVAKIVRDNGLSKAFGTSPREYVFLEGWLTISRVQNESSSVKVMQIFSDGTTGEQIVHARATLKDSFGRVVERADGYCSTGEGRWADKPFYARASMAQTRALGKAMRTRHAWVMVMAGYEPTPLEEVEDILPPAPPPAPAKPKKAAPQLPPGEPKLVTKKLKPEESKLHPPQETQEAAPGQEVVFIKAFGDPAANGRMGVLCIWKDGSESWANIWHNHDQEAMRGAVLANKKAAREAGQDPRAAGQKFVATVKRTPKKEGEGEWVDLTDLVEVAND